MTNLHDSDEEHVIEFWNQTVYEYSYAVSQSFTFETKTLVKQFILHDRVPVGLPAILRELKGRNKLVPKQMITSGAFYGVG